MEIDGGAIYRNVLSSLREFHRAKSCCHLYGAQGAKANDRRTYHPQGVLSQNWGGTEQNRAVPCMVLKAKANDRRKNLALSRDELRGP
ncbi:hypothetical protein TNCV_878791 [Trichonephila clavipes]|nr:hypothetical protein TNCV_878791 [Trichonephila clavipes]